MFDIQGRTILQNRVQRHKIESAQRQAGDTKIAALIHGYGPVDEFRNRFELAFNAADNLRGLTGIVI